MRARSISGPAAVLSEPANRWSSQAGDALTCCHCSVPAPDASSGIKGRLFAQQFMRDLPSSVSSVRFIETREGCWSTGSRSKRPPPTPPRVCYYRSHLPPHGQPCTYETIRCHIRSRARDPPQQLNDSLALSHRNRMLIESRSHIDCPDGNRKSQR